MALAFDLRKITATFSRVIDFKSRFTRRHSKGLTARAARMAERYGWTEEDRARLQIAADLHDIGKLTVSNAILDKPGGLEPRERDAVETTPTTPAWCTSGWTARDTRSAWRRPASIAGVGCSERWIPTRPRDVSRLRS